MTLTLVLWTALIIGFTNGQLQLPTALLPSVGGVGALTRPSSAGLVYAQREVLNETTGTVVEWTVEGRNSSSAGQRITFNFTTNLNSTGSDWYIVFGLSIRGNVSGADLVLLRNSQDILDMYGDTNTTLAADTVQNWELISVQRLSSQVTVIFSRYLETCDREHDIRINTDLLNLIWGVGENLPGNISSLPFTPAGSVRAYLADPVRPNATATDHALQNFRFSRTFLIPPRRTSYWCTIHRGPVLASRHHIIQHVPFFANATSEQHIHHQLLHRCITPPGVDPALIFERYVGHPGEECYLEQTHQLPTHLCTQIRHSWGVGGKTFTFPDNAGMSIGETPNEYYMLESHYDNPEMRADLFVENGVDIYYTPNIRPNEATILLTGAGVLGLFRVPPGSGNFTVGGQCSSQCTAQMVASVGGEMEILGTLLHAHMATTGITLRHYRGNVELPLIQKDSNYDFSFQQMRLLPEPTKILPGDKFTVECDLNTTSRNRTTLSGFSTIDEMCATFILVNKPVGYLYCSSEYPTDNTLDQFGIQNITWHRELQERIVNEATNQSFVGQTFQNVVDTQSGPWTEASRRQLQDEQLYGRHTAICPPVRAMTMLAYGAYFMEAVTGGLISLRDRVENSRPTTASVSTPAPLATPTVWPRPFSEYQEPSRCV